jgi:uncharacterized protein (TIGR02246 family)
MPAATIRDVEDVDIRERIDTLAQAIRTKDIDALMTHYAPDVVVFDIRPPARIRGVDAYRKNFEAWFASVKGRIDYEVHDLSIAKNGEVAFCCCLSHVRSVPTTGEKLDYRVRVTSCLQKMGGQWLVAHEHISMPIDMRTMRAVSELQA